jgi:uncharacterized protein (TIGR02118 family)
LYKLILIFSKVEGVDLDFIEHRWSHEFVPLAESMPGLRLVSISRMNKAITPNANIHLIHELFFDDLDALDAAMRSPEGQQAGRLLMDFAGESVQVYFAEHKEDTPTPVADKGKAPAEGGHS